METGLSHLKEHVCNKFNYSYKGLITYINVDEESHIL